MMSSTTSRRIRWCSVHDHSHPPTVEEAVAYSLAQDEPCQYVLSAITELWFQEPSKKEIE